jgi:hypothetical protein
MFEKANGRVARIREDGSKIPTVVGVLLDAFPSGELKLACHDFYIRT